MQLSGATVLVAGPESSAASRLAAGFETQGIRTVRSAAGPAEVGRVDALVYCLGRARVQDRPSYPAPGPELVDASVHSALLAPIQLARAVLPGMLARGRGHLAFVDASSAATADTDPFHRAAHAALLMFVDSMQLEMRGTGVGVGTWHDPMTGPRALEEQDPLVTLLVEQMAATPTRDDLAGRRALAPAVRALVARARRRSGRLA